MMFDSQLLIAELHSFDILLQHHIRQSSRARDMATLQRIGETLAKLSDSVRGEIKILRKPERWCLLCMECGFTWGENVSAKNSCPDCGTGLIIWDFARGKPRLRAA